MAVSHISPCVQHFSLWQHAEGGLTEGIVLHCGLSKHLCHVTFHEEFAHKADSRKADLVTLWSTIHFQ